jgi:hypothetical protein
MRAVVTIVADKHFVPPRMGRLLMDLKIGGTRKRLNAKATLVISLLRMNHINMLQFLVIMLKLFRTVNAFVCFGVMMDYFHVLTFIQRVPVDFATNLA